MAEHYPVSVGAGTLCIDDGYPMTHAWTGSGVTIDATFSGAHLLHLAVAGCVLNDVYREADKQGIALDGVQVSAQGGFGPQWESTGIEYTVAVASQLSPEQVERLLVAVDQAAEVPSALRQGTSVRRVGQ